MFSSLILALKITKAGKLGKLDVVFPWQQTINQQTHHKGDLVLLPVQKQKISVFFQAGFGHQ